MRARRPKLNEELMNDFLKKLDAGKSVSKAAQELEVDRLTVYRWVRWGNDPARKGSPYEVFANTYRKYREINPSAHANKNLVQYVPQKRSKR